jgi:hypothetical protein
MYTTVDVEIAATSAALEEACRLVHDVYVACGYMTPHRSGARIGWHQTLGTSRVFVARDEGRVVGTITLVPDSVHGLPCDRLYPWELAAMRARGERLAEATALAVDAGHRATGGDYMRPLMRALGTYALHGAACTTLCITVNPRHRDVYERRLGFERFGAVKPYAAVNGAPAVPLRLDLAQAAARLKTLHFIGACDVSLRRSLGEVC